MTAFHEAGHAVAAIRLGRRVKRLDISGDLGEDTLGEFEQYRQGRRISSDGDPTPAEWREVIERIQICFAGPEAERRVRGKRNLPGAGSDHERIIALALLLLPSPGEELHAFCNWLEIRTRAIFDDPYVWKGVEAVAAALLEQEKLGGNQVHEIYCDAVGPEFREWRERMRRRRSRPR
jgi:hypothetical protein